MRTPRPFPLILALLVAGSLAGCGGDSGHDEAPATARLTVVVDANVGEGRLAVDAPISASRLVVERSGDVLLAGLYAVYRIDARTGTLTAVPGTELTTCADGSSVETSCGTGITAVAVDAAGRIYFGVGDGRLLRVGREGGAATRVAGEFFYRCPDRLPIAGPAEEVCIGFISDLAFDRAGNLIIADGSQARILRFDPVARTITVVAGTGIGAGPCPEDVPAAEACIESPTGIAVDPAGGIVIGSSNQTVHRIDPVTGIISRIVGRAEYCFSDDPRGDGGPARDACLSTVVDVASDDRGTLYIADQNDPRIRRVDGVTGTITSFDGTTFDRSRIPGAVAVDDDGRLFDLAYSVRFGGQELRRFGAGPGSATTIAGNGSFGFCGDGGPARDACLGYADDVTLGPDGSIYVADLFARRIRRVADGIITTVAGNGLLASPGETCADGVAAIDTCIDAPAAVAVGADGFYVLDGTGDFGFNHVRRVGRDGTIDTVIGGCRVEGDAASVPAADACLHVSSMAIGPDGALWVAEFERVSRFDAATGRLVPVFAVPPDCVPFNAAPTPTCFPIRRIAFDRSGNLYLADEHYVRRVDAGATTATIIAGSGREGFCGDGGPATDACLLVGRIVLDGDGNVFVAAAGAVRRIDAATGIITTVAGSTDGHCPFNFGDVVPPGLGCATVHAIDDAGRLVYPELSRFTVGRVVRLDVPVGHPVP